MCVCVCSCACVCEEEAISRSCPGYDNLRETHSGLPLRSCFSSLVSFFRHCFGRSQGMGLPLMLSLRFLFVFVYSASGSHLLSHIHLVLESERCSVVSDSLWPRGLYSPWNSLGQNTGVDSGSLLQGIFPTQESNWCLLHCRWDLLAELPGTPSSLVWSQGLNLSLPPA